MLSRRAFLAALLPRSSAFLEKFNAEPGLVRLVMVLSPT